MTRLLICAVVVGVAESAIRHATSRAGYSLGLALIAVALWLAYAAGGA